MNMGPSIYGLGCPQEKGVNQDSNNKVECKPLKTSHSLTSYNNITSTVAMRIA